MHKGGRRQLFFPGTDEGSLRQKKRSQSLVWAFPGGAGNMCALAVGMPSSMGSGRVDLCGSL